jgi:rSAM/selenodomain-associated transferase 1
MSLEFLAHGSGEAGGGRAVEPVGIEVERGDPDVVGIDAKRDPFGGGEAADAEGGGDEQDQGEGDLGARMQRALSRRLASHERVLLIGTDAPSLDANVLRAAAAALDGHDAVFVPALDGGYALVGLARLGQSLSKPPSPANAAPARLFESIEWSTATVMARTLERVAELGLCAALLPALPDIDEPADLAHLPPSWPEARHP